MRNARVDFAAGGDCDIEHHPRVRGEGLRRCEARGDGSEGAPLDRPPKLVPTASQHITLDPSVCIAVNIQNSGRGLTGGGSHHAGRGCTRASTRRGRPAVLQGPSSLQRTADTQLLDHTAASGSRPARSAALRASRFFSHASLASTRSSLHGPRVNWESMFS